MRTRPSDLARAALVLGAVTLAGCRVTWSDLPGNAPEPAPAPEAPETPTYLLAQDAVREVGFTPQNVARLRTWMSPSEVIELFGPPTLRTSVYDEDLEGGPWKGLLFVYRRDPGQEPNRLTFLAETTPPRLRTWDVKPYSPSTARAPALR